MYKKKKNNNNLLSPRLNLFFSILLTVAALSTIVGNVCLFSTFFNCNQMTFCPSPFYNRQQETPPPQNKPAVPHSQELSLGGSRSWANSKQTQSDGKFVLLALSHCLIFFTMCKRAKELRAVAVMLVTLKQMFVIFVICSFPLLAGINCCPNSVPLFKLPGFLWSGLLCFGQRPKCVTTLFQWNAFCFLSNKFSVDMKRKMKHKSVLNVLQELA